MIKKLLKNHIIKNVPDNKVAILLSGGLDSISVGLAASNAGKTVHAYSFHLDTHKSYDFLKAEGLEFKKDFYSDGSLKPDEQLFFSITIMPFGKGTSPNINQ